MLLIRLRGDISYFRNGIDVDILRRADIVVEKLIFERNVFVIDGFVRLAMYVEFAYQVQPPLSLEND